MKADIEHFFRTRAPSAEDVRLHGAGRTHGRRPCAVAMTRLAAVMSMLAFSAGLAHANPDNPSVERGIADETSDYIQDYLSDARRVGALAGSILGGALTAHPAGTVVGSLIGFFIGKQTMFEYDKRGERQSSVFHARRDIVPAEGAGSATPTLSFANPQAITFDSPPAATQAAAPAPALAGSPALQAPVISASKPGVYAAALALAAAPREAPAVFPTPTPPTLQPPRPTNLSREQIAQVCASGQGASDPRLHMLCFYFRGG